MAEEKEIKETETTENPNKLNSRKFIVFVVGSIFCIASMAYGIVKNETNLINKSLDSFIFVAGFYIAGNSVNKWCNVKKEA